MESKASSVDFGVLIAFIAPGFVALKATSYHSATAADWMANAALREQTVGVFLFALLASLSLGLGVSGVRALLVDRLFQKSLWKYSVPRPLILWHLADETRLTTLVTIRDNYYRYYQFYANTAVALLIWAIARCVALGEAMSWRMLFTGVAIIALLFSAHDSWERYVKAVNGLFEHK